jgi:hypothetical protein
MTPTAAVEMATTFRAGHLVRSRGDLSTRNDDGSRRYFVGDVVRVSKDGRRVQVSYWGHGRMGEGKRFTGWFNASDWEVA